MRALIARPGWAHLDFLKSTGLARASDPGVGPGDVFINLVEVPKENWSFGNGVAQYAL